MEKKFTILTSSFNSGCFLSDWASSILKQSYRPLEVVFVNDQSEDKTVSKIESIRDKFDKNNIDLKIIHNKKRLYCGSSYKVALEYATGYYVGVLDSDDMLEDDSCNIVSNIYNMHNEISWIYTQFFIYTSNWGKKKVGMSKCPPSGKSLLDLGIEGQHGFSHWRTFLKDKCSQGNIFKDGLKCAVDKYMGYRLEEIGSGMFVDYICYKYRQRTSYSLTTMEKGGARSVWKEVIKEAVDRRIRENITPFPICSYKA